MAIQCSGGRSMVGVSSYGSRAMVIVLGWRLLQHGITIHDGDASNTGCSPIALCGFSCRCYGPP
jgi:hypothetical protein